jgi:hypothetical protein
MTSYFDATFLKTSPTGLGKRHERRCGAVSIIGCGIFEPGSTASDEAGQTGASEVPFKRVQITMRHGSDIICTLLVEVEGTHNHTVG